MDDSAPVPIFSDVPVIPEQQVEANQDDMRKASAYWHPAWESVQQRFEDIIAGYEQKNAALGLKDLPAEEFKINVMVSVIVCQELTNIMEMVKDAVTAVESTKRSTSK